MDINLLNIVLHTHCRCECWLTNVYFGEKGLLCFEGTYVCNT